MLRNLFKLKHYFSKNEVKKFRFEKKHLSIVIHCGLSNFLLVIQTSHTLFHFPASPEIIVTQMSAFKLPSGWPVAQLVYLIGFPVGSHMNLLNCGLYIAPSQIPVSEGWLLLNDYKEYLYKNVQKLIQWIFVVDLNFHINCSLDWLK